MSQKTRGMLFASLSALFFGWSGVITKIIAIGGVGIPSILLFRGIMGACLLFPLLRRTEQPLYIPFWLLKRILFLSVLGTTLTLLLLNMAYTYIPVGSATTIHYLYPVAVTMAESFISRQKPDKLTCIVLLICTLSLVPLFEGFPPGSQAGLLFAGLSVFSWSFQLIYLDRSCLKQVPNFTLAFYQSCTTALVGLLAGVFVPHTWDAALTQMPLFLLVGLMNSVLATVLLRASIQRVGAGIAAVLSVFEPVSAILFGVLLGEAPSLPQLFASALVLSSITVMIWISARKGKGSIAA